MSDDGRSPLAKALHSAAPWLDAVSRLTGGAIAGLLAGYLADRNFDIAPWGLVAGGVCGISFGLYAFLSAALRMGKKP